MNKILIIDDDYIICCLYQEELKEAGYEVITSVDCENLMDAIAQHRPVLIVLDVMMGEFYGLDILQEIRNTYYDMPVILCSAYSTFRYDMKSIAADYYVTKSMDLTELKFKIRMALEGKMQTSESWISEFQERHPLRSYGNAM